MKTKILCLFSSDFKVHVSLSDALLRLPSRAINTLSPKQAIKLGKRLQEMGEYLEANNGK